MITLTRHVAMACAVGALSLSMTARCGAAVSAEEAEKLKSELMPLGGERAASKDGSIPPWDGGYTKVPAGFKAGQPRPDPFAGEKPLYAITAKNMDQHAEQLTDGQKLLLKKYASYRIDVYPTHRTAAAPQWVYDNTFKNASRSKTSSDGLSVQGAVGGIPFPIPKTGAEVMWNHLLRWNGESVKQGKRAYVVSGGKAVLASETMSEMSFPYYFRDGSSDDKDLEYWQLYMATVAPAFKAGEIIVARDPLDQVHKGRQTWQYLIGQRRVRRAPSVAYDTPNSVTSGVDFFDEAMLFNGAMDKYQWKLVGKKEMVVPYNANSFFLKKASDVLGPNHINPDHMRFELHRVWVVEAELAPGKRHVLPKRRFYIDEDSWNAMWSDGWDAQGQLWHSGMALPFLAFDFPGQIQWTFVTYDHLKDSYSCTTMNEAPEHYTPVPRWPASNFTPESMAARGVR